jgi:polysaccharide transporter, PST family
MSRRVVGNAASIMSVQVGSYILPLINVPYLLRVIGPEHYGLITFSQAVMTYFITLNDYGFNLSATRDLALCRENETLRSELYSTVMSIKAGLCLVSFAILSVLIHLVPRFHDNRTVFFASFGMVVGSMLFPQWFFQGIEKMYWISVANLSANLLFTIGIFVFVRKPSDFVLAAIVQAGGKLAAGIIGLSILFSTERVKLRVPRSKQVRDRIVDGWHLFISQAAVQLYTSSNAVVLGFVRGMTQVGYFSAAYKILAAGLGLVSPMCQAMYPHVCSLASRSRQLAIAYLRKAMIFIGGITLVGGVAVLVFAVPIVRIAMGPKYLAAAPVVQLMALIPFACAINNIYGTQAMLNFGMRTQFSQIIIASSFLNIIILFPLSYCFGACGAAACGLVTEVLVTILMGIVLYKRGIDLMPRFTEMRLGSLTLASLNRTFRASDAD